MYIVNVHAVSHLNNVQEENELHERLAELERKERYLVARGRDQTRQPEQGMYMYTTCC